MQVRSFVTLLSQSFQESDLEDCMRGSASTFVPEGWPRYWIPYELLASVYEALSELTVTTTMSSSEEKTTMEKDHPSTPPPRQRSRNKRRRVGQASASMLLAAGLIGCFLLTIVALNVYMVVRLQQQDSGTEPAVITYLAREQQDDELTDDQTWAEQSAERQRLLHQRLEEKLHANMFHLDTPKTVAKDGEDEEEYYDDDDAAVAVEEDEMDAGDGAFGGEKRADELEHVTGRITEAPLRGRGGTNNNNHHGMGQRKHGMMMMMKKKHGMMMMGRRNPMKPVLN